MMEALETQKDAEFLASSSSNVLELHRSNLLRFEVNELLDECRHHHHDSLIGFAKEYLQTLRDAIPNLEIPDNLFGVTKPSGNANLPPIIPCAMVVSNQFWNKKDYLHNRYFEKRNELLCKIGHELSLLPANKIGKVQWQYYCGDRNTPCLLLTHPASKKRRTQKVRFRVRIVVAMESLDWIPPVRLFPNRSNLGGNTPASPHYNARLVQDAFWTQTPKLLREDDCVWMSDTVILAKIWSLQRGLLRNHQTQLTETHWAVLLLYLYRTKHISKRMSALQAFTALMKHCAERLLNSVLVVPSEEDNAQSRLYQEQIRQSPLTRDDPPTLLECFRKHSDCPVVLLDPSMRFNYFQHLTPCMARWLSYQAQDTLNALNGNSKTTMARIFLTNARFYEAHDAYVCIPLDQVDWNKTTTKDDLGDPVASLSRSIVSLLTKALGDRVHHVVVLGTAHAQEEAPVFNLKKKSFPTVPDKTRTWTGGDALVLGFSWHGENCHRMVDRGPPADDPDAVRSFLQLWGSAAQLRRFKDGTIVHAVAWNDASGDVVEGIVGYVLRLHFLETAPRFLLRDMMGLIDPSSSTAAHRAIMVAFESLSQILRDNNNNNLPLDIDAVEPLSPALRHSELFPPMPHPLLSGDYSGGKLPGALVYAPILIQIRFGRSSKWPTDMKAMAAAKTAMLIQLANGMEQSATIHVVAPGYLDLGYQGYSWRIVVRADPELHLLRGLHKPSPEAISLLNVLVQEHVVASMHHSMVHKVHTSHPSSSGVVRLAKRWMAAHLLSGLIPLEAIDLMVAYIYSDNHNPLEPPTTVVAGFMRWLLLLATHDWARRPLVVDPYNDMDDVSAIQARFEQERGPDCKGPPMYIVSCNDNVATAFTRERPEWVVLTRAAALAKRSHDYLVECLASKDGDWMAVFRERPSSFKSHSMLLRVDSDFVVDSECSSTTPLETSFARSMKNRFVVGPKALRIKAYRNLGAGVLHNWTPVESTVEELRERFRSVALFFYNELTPEVIGVLWRPTRFVKQPFRALASEYARPIDDNTMDNVKDIMREMMQYVRDIVVDVKVLDDKTIKEEPKNEESPACKKQKHSSSDDDTSDEE